MSTKKDNELMASLYIENTKKETAILSHNRRKPLGAVRPDDVAVIDDVAVVEDEEGGIIPDSVKQQIRDYLEKRVADAEAKNKGYQERGENSWIGVVDADSIMEDLERHNPGISSLEDYLNWEDYQTYYDIYKDYHGISPRWTSWKDSDDWSGEIDKLAEENSAENDLDKKESDLEYEFFGSRYGSGGDIPAEPNKKFKDFARAAGKQDLFSDNLPDFFAYRLQLNPEMESEMQSAWKDNYRVGQQSGSATPEFDNSIAAALKSVQ